MEKVFTVNVFNRKQGHTVIIGIDNFTECTKLIEKKLKDWQELANQLGANYRASKETDAEGKTVGANIYWESGFEETHKIFIEQYK